MVAWWNLRLAAARVLARAGAIHRKTEALEQFNRATRLLVPDQAWWRANPLGMLWPEIDEAFVASAGGNRRPPTTAQRQMVLVNAG